MPQDPVSPFSIRVLGPLQVERGGVPLPRLRSRKGHWILALLLLRHPGEVERAWLAGTLWPDSAPAQALANLRNSLRDLRRALGSEAHRLLSPTPRTLALDLCGAEVDLLRFDAALARADSASLQQAITLYRGPLLEDCAEEWILHDREVREQSYLRALETLAGQAMAGGDAETAACYLRRAVAVDPLRESAQRELMAVLSETGNYAAALEVYRELRLRLHREMNAEPDPETRQLHERLRAEARSPARRRSARDASPTQDAGIPFPVSIPELPGELPPSALTRHPNNLPAPPRPLLGREREVAVLWEWLRGDNVRLLTLTGPGGIGKTRLGLQVATELLDTFADGVFFVDLAPLRDPSLVGSAIAQVLGVHEAGERGLLESVKQHLRGKQMLLLLDNFEHLLAAAPLVADLLAAAPRLKVLMTSRAALRVRGEQEFPVAPLAVPDPRQLPPLETLSQYASVELFIQRAANVQPDFMISNENAPAVAEICHRLEGLPLAIELAAARIKLFSPKALLMRLGDRLNLLTGGARDLPERQQTLRGTIAWSYDLLAKGEQALFRRFAVFIGGCTLEAMEAICRLEDERDSDLLASVTALVDQSLLLREERATAPTQEGARRSAGPVEPRFWMLETIRQYSHDRLLEQEEAEAVRRRHRDWFVTLAEQAEPELYGAQQVVWLMQLDGEIDNLRAAMAWGLETEPESTLRVAAALWRYWDIRGHRIELRQILERGLALVERDTPTSSRARALGSLGWVMFRQGDFKQAKALLKEGIELCRTLKDERSMSLLGNHLGVVSLWQGELGPAHDLFQESLSIRRRLHDMWGVAASLACLGHVARWQGDLVTARCRYEESLSIQRQIGDRRGIGITLNYVAETARQLGNHEGARFLHEEGLVIRREIGDKGGIAESLRYLGELLLAQGNLEEADRILHESLVVSQETGGRALLAHIFKALGRGSSIQGDYSRACEFLTQSLAIFRESGNRQDLASILALLAVALAGSGEVQRAVPLLGAVKALSEASGWVLPSAEQAAYDCCVAKTRSQLGPEAFAAAAAAGRAMPLDDAINYAFEAASPHQSP